MVANPFLGVFFHWMGGLASGSFYVPYKGVKKWSWETYWLVGGFFSWIIAPWLLAMLLTSDTIGVIRSASGSTLWWAYFFGAMWGLGGLTFGLTMRYLGMSLGMGVALGYCAAFGTLMPPIFKQFLPNIPVAETLGQIASTGPGQITLAGVGVCLIGIIIAALAGLTKEREMPAAEKKKAVAEFSFTKGILVATFSGIMSACFAFGLTAGEPMAHLTLKADYIASAKAAGKTIVNVAPVDPEQASKLAEELKTAGFFGADAKAAKEKPTLAGIVEALERPIVLQAKLDSLKKDSAGKTEAIANVEKDLKEAKVAVAAQQSALAAAKSPLVAQVAKYAHDFGSIAAKTEEATTIGGLKDFAVKEVAVATVLAGANYVEIHSKHQLWQGLPRLCIVLLGGFTTNFIWCVLLNIKNRTGYQYLATHVRPEHAGLVASGGEHGGGAVAAAGPSEADLRIPRLGNLFFSALAGTTWYMQFFFYSMGETQMGKFGFASWTLHMASIIIFSTMWGWIFHEWKGASKKSHGLIAGGIVTLILSTIIIGWATWLKGQAGGH